MFFEKNKPKKFTETEAFIDLLLLLTLSILALDILYIVNPFSAGFWDVKLIDIINAVAQFATSGAFIFAIFQYNKNKESERQLFLIEECRDLIERMCAVCNVYSGSDNHGLKQTSKFVAKMDGLGTNFNEIFGELTECTQKAIIRMRWQEMYFSDLRHAMEAWNIIDIIRDLGAPSEFINRVRLVYLRERKKSRSDRTDLFAEYNTIKKILEHPKVKPALMSTADITSDFLFFEIKFFSNDSLIDHLYGYFNMIDARVRAPTLTALNEYFNEDLKNLWIEQKKKQSKSRAAQRR